MTARQQQCIIKKQQMETWEKKKMEETTGINLCFGLTSFLIMFREREHENLWRIA
jgi:hypothetical protein